MTYYKVKNNIKKYEYKNTNKYSRNVISLPVYPKLKNKEIVLFVSQLMKQLMNKKKFYLLVDVDLSVIIWL